MRTCVSSRIKIVAVLLSLVFILTACGGSKSSADYKNPNKAVDAYVSGQSIIGKTVDVKATLSDTANSSTACSFYTDGYNGSLKENVLVLGRGVKKIEKGKTYTIKITEARKSNNTYVIIGDFV